MIDKDTMVRVGDVLDILEEHIKDAKSHKGEQRKLQFFRWDLAELVKKVANESTRERT